MRPPRQTNATELRRLLAEDNASEVASRVIEHLQAAGHTLPTVLDGLTLDERERLVLMLFTLVGNGSAVH
jgi:hypothetical protein